MTNEKSIQKKVGNYVNRHRLLSAIAYSYKLRNKKLMFSRDKLANILGCSRSTLYKNLSELKEFGLIQELDCKSYRITEDGMNVYKNTVVGNDHDTYVNAKFAEIYKPKSTDTQEGRAERLKALNSDTPFSQVPYVDVSTMSEDRWNIELAKDVVINIGDLLSNTTVKRYIHLVREKQGESGWKFVKDKLVIAYKNQVVNKEIKNMAVFVSSVIQQVFDVKKWFISTMKVFLGRKPVFTVISEFVTRKAKTLLNPKRAENAIKNAVSMLHQNLQSAFKSHHDIKIIEKYLSYIQWDQNQKYVYIGVKDIPSQIEHEVMKAISAGKIWMGNVIHNSLRKQRVDDNYQIQYELNFI